MNLEEKYELLKRVVERYANPNSWDEDTILFDDCESINGEVTGGCMARMALRQVSGENIEPNEGIVG